jgi:hypothetical protein
MGSHSTIEERDGQVVLFHRVYAHEGFEESARAIFRVIQVALKAQPGKKRIFFLLIDGHRNAAGGFDAEMLELQGEFMFKHVMPFLTEIHIPLGAYRNSKPQRDDAPEGVTFASEAEKF